MAFHHDECAQLPNFGAEGGGIWMAGNGRANMPGKLVWRKPIFWFDNRVGTFDADSWCLITLFGPFGDAHGFEHESTGKFRELDSN